MSRMKMLYLRLKESSRNVPFNDQCKLAEGVGFTLDRQKGSHRVYKHDGFSDGHMNFQSRKGEAIPYQVRQLIKFIEDKKIIPK